MIHLAFVFAAWVNLAQSANRSLSYIDQIACRTYARQYHVPVALARSLRHAESHGDVYAVHHNSGYGPDMGLYQINWRTYLFLSERYNDGVLKWPYDPVANTEMALHYLSDLYTATGGWSAAVAAYNAGMSAQVPTSTVAYVHVVMTDASM